MNATSTHHLRGPEDRGYERAGMRVLVTGADAATLRRARRLYGYHRLEVIDEIGDALSRCAKARYDLVICGLPQHDALAEHFLECLEVLNPTLTSRTLFLAG